MTDKTQIEDNYTQEKITINLVRANVFSLAVFAVSFIVFGILFIFIRLNNDNIFGNTGFSIFSSQDALWYLPFINILVFIVIFFIGIVLHEGIHGIFFAGYAEGKFKSVKFGILPKEKLFTPFCHCKEILKINHYRIAAIMPTIILGVIPAVISITTGLLPLLFYGVLFTGAGSGDLLMVFKLTKEKNNVLIYDLPDDAGFIIYRPK